MSSSSVSRHVLIFSGLWNFSRRSRVSSLFRHCCVRNTCCGGHAEGHEMSPLFFSHTEKPKNTIKVVKRTDREHLGGAGSLLWVPHQHGLYKVIKMSRPKHKKHICIFGAFKWHNECRCMAGYHLDLSFSFGGWYPLFDMRNRTLQEARCCQHKLVSRQCVKYTHWSTRSVSHFAFL